MIDPIKVRVLDGEPRLRGSEGCWLVVQSGDNPSFALEGPYIESKADAIAAWNEMARKLNGDDK